MDCGHTQRYATKMTLTNWTMIAIEYFKVTVVYNTIKQCAGENSDPNSVLSILY
jgi:hypothetical protein